MVLFLFIVNSALGQVVSTNLSFPQENKALTITFNAAEGTKGLQDFTGDVYAHIGVITDKSTSSSDWKYVVSDWGVNIAKAKCTRIAANTYELTLSPDIRSFFAVPQGEEILQIAIVFRSSTGSPEAKAEGGKDILVKIFEPELDIKLTAPTSPAFFVDVAEKVVIEGETLMADRYEIFVDDVSVKTGATASFSYEHTAEVAGSHIVRVVGYDDTNNKTVDTQFTYTVRAATQIAALPDGVVDGVNIINNTTVTFVVHAPHKESVHVIGDFNAWIPESNYTMARTASDITNENLRYWITIDGLTPGKEYAFQYIIDENLRIADPYTEKVIDPSNDRWIPTETYTSSYTYPSGKTDGILSTFNTSETPYTWTATNYEAPKKSDLVIYEMLVRDFTVGPEDKEGNYTNAIAKLDYLETLGVNAIELMPVNEFEGNNSWGYNPSFMFAVDKAYGAKNDLKKFIDECHKRGMAVIIDIVMNHQFGQSPLVQMYLDKHGEGETFSLPQSPWFNVKSPNQTYKWGADLNHESIHTQKLLDRLNAFWLNEFKVDGFRFDFTKGFTNTAGDGWAKDDARIAIMKRMYDEIVAVNQNAYVILEHLTDNAEETELANYGLMLWGNMNHSYSNAVAGNVSGTNSDISNTYYVKRGWNNPHLISYMESHDEERLMYVSLNEGQVSGGHNTRSLNTALYRVGMAASFFFTVPGPKMIWQFGEVGYDFSINENGRVGTKPIKWEYIDNVYRAYLYNTFAALAKLKTTQPVFNTGNYTYKLNREVKQATLDGDDLDIVVVGNFDIYNKVDHPVTFTQTGTWYEHFTGKEIQIENLEVQFNLQPGQFHFFTSKKLDQPNMPDIAIEPISFEEISTSITRVWNSDVTIYPNPTTKTLIINKASEIDFIGVYDASGKLINKIKTNQSKTEYTIDLPAQTSGMFYIMLQNKKGQTAVRKVIKK